jgi:hypothetical protein
MENDKLILKEGLQQMIKNVSKMKHPIATYNHRIYPKEVLLKALNEKLEKLIDLEEEEGDK